MEFVLGVASIGFVVSLFLTSKYPKAIYYWGFVSLYIQSLILIFRFSYIHLLLTNVGGDLWTFYRFDPVLSWAIITSTIAFPIPFLLAFFTATLSSNITYGIASCFAYSIAQVIMLGAITGQTNPTKNILATIKNYAFPVFSFIITIWDLFGAEQIRIFNLAPKDIAFFVSICCCQIVLITALPIVWWFGRKK